MIEIVLDDVPKPCPRPRASRTGHVYMPRDYIVRKAELARALAEATDGYTTHEGPINVEIVFTYRAPTKKVRGQARSNGPDLDNLAKTVLDAGTDAGLWRDDREISTLTLSKRWGTVPELRIRVM